MRTVARTNIEIDDELIRRVMQVYGFTTKREAVEFALQKLIGGKPMSVDEMLAMRGRGWSGDLDEIRAANRRRYERLERLRNR
jgi:Arc/MetJ family transcription regulator